MNLRYTDEQQAAIQSFLDHGNTRVVAYAGAGKTSTLVGMARQRGVRALYIAFNKSIAADAGHKFGGTGVESRTAHSLAYRNVKSMGYSDDKMRGTVNTRNMGRVAPAPELSEQVTKQLVIGTIRNFCQSAHANIKHSMVPRLAKPIEDPQVMLAIKEHVAKCAMNLWHNMISLHNPTGLGHDGYLKIWALTEPRLDASYRYLMVDEAQDLNPVLIGIVKAQQCPVISVGDPHQQIYAWRGAIDALKFLPGPICRITQSFRFGSNIASFANRLLDSMGERVPLRGNGRTDDRVSTPDFATTAILCRTNSGVISNLMNLVEADNPVHVPGGSRELMSLVDDTDRLQEGRPAQTAELLGFNNWHEVVDHSKTDEGRGLQSFVGLVDKYGTIALRNVLSRVQEVPMIGSTTVSTAHKAKGLEWEDVELADDFTKVTDPSIEDRRLFYVAATRAKHELAVDPCVFAPYMRPMENRNVDEADAA